MTQKSILVVEDNLETRELLSYNLKSAGYAVRLAADGVKALELASRAKPDLILLDVMLPDGLDGLEVCRRLKQDERTRSVPVIMLTALGDEVDRIVGLELGAEDYVAKPFSPRELLLRIKVVLRRAGVSAQDQTDGFSEGGLAIDFAAHSVLVDGTAVALTSTELKLLRELVRSRGRVLQRERLLDTVWDTDFDGTSRTVDTHMRRLRAKLGPYADWIETVRGAGYRFKPQQSPAK